jgi:two-component system NtrC family sensor kinase
LNNPIQAIQNALFLLKEEKGISLQGKQDLDIVLAESERMANMIEQLRATYRPVQTEDFRMTQVNSIVEDVHTLISPHLRQNQVIFEFQPNPDLPPILAHSDQIRQVILNLFMNAVEAMADGGKLSIETKLSEDQNEVVLTVIDTGTGISPAILPNIFEAFVTDKQKGTGLGLTISYDIVTKHRGRITAQNNPERGSTFKVWLPVQSTEIK